MNCFFTYEDEDEGSWLSWGVIGKCIWRRWSHGCLVD